MIQLTSIRTRRPAAAANKLLVASALALSALVASPLQALNQDAKQEFSKLPGYVDFSTLGEFNEDEAVVEVYLHDELLAMVAQMAGGADPELSEVLQNLKLVRVQRYELDTRKIRGIEKNAEEMVGKLEKQGWTRVVRVREEDERVYVYFKLGKELLQGITIVALENDFVNLVNIVGDIDPQAVGRLGRRFNIEQLDPDWLNEWDHGDSSKSRKRDH